MSVKEFSIRVQREVRGGSFQVATTIIFCFFIVIFVVMLVVFVHDRYKEVGIREDLYLPPLYSLSASSRVRRCDCESSLHHFSGLVPEINTSSNTTSYNELKERISPKGIWHSMSDNELMWRASMRPRILEYPYKRTPKVAFLFLTRETLPLATLWEGFFKGHEGLFSIYIHTSPNFTTEPLVSSVFYKRRIPSKPVQWGKATMVDAERRLLANALLDFSNERFVLLSETCIPLFEFTTIYNYLLNSNQSFLNSFDDPRRIGRGRYNKRMFPAITLSDWRKGSQWFEINRKLAVEIVSDVTYYPIFRNHCRPPCYMDEHYLPTLVNKVCPQLTSNRTITWADWSARRSHPRMFVRKDVSQEFLDGIRFGNNCTYNDGITSVCFLFGRKFHPSTLQPLLSIAPNLLGFEP